ncbi:MAG: hypothetical protein KGL39_15100 [Patescibacteria group bacterium]|nr:hypothetical protein [Patescibacteria group bacterium]
MSAAAPAVSPTGYQPYQTPIPGVDQYAAADTLATNAYNKALAQINESRLNTLTGYGYTGTVDPNSGVIGGVRVDPNSVYGSLQQLFHTQALQDRNAQWAAEDRGLHGGLANQARTELRYAHGAQDASLGNDLLSRLSGYAEDQRTAAATRDNALWQNEQARLDAEMQAEYNQSIQDLISQMAGGQGKGKGTDTPPAALPPTNGVLSKPGANPSRGGIWLNSGNTTADQQAALVISKLLGRAVAT